MTEVDQLEQAIAALEAQRALLGDSVVETALMSMWDKLAALKAHQISPEQQRKFVTVLFADVSGYTAISETMDAEVVAEVMNALWQQLDQIINLHGGWIDKHMGDGVMALWGADQGQEDDPEQAIRAGLLMQKALAHFRETHQVQLVMRIGINTGPALLGQVGTTGEFTAMGDTVNTASRLEHATPVGEIMISHNTYRHVRGVFEVEPQAPIPLKGKRDPVRTYLVKSAKPRAFRMPTRGLEGIETRTIGREAELLTLQNAHGDAFEKRQTTLVTIVADPGIGKSRLLYEFENWVELLPQLFRHFKGRAIPETLLRPSGLLRDMFSYRFDILDTDRSETVRAKFQTGMTGLMENDKIAVLGQVAGFDFSSVPAVQAALANPGFDQMATTYLVNYFHLLTETAPTLILLEDIHWADDRSLDLLHRLLASLTQRPLLVICLARPSLYERCPTWGTGIFRSIRLDLQPLSTQNSHALVREILQKVDDLPVVVRNTVVESAEGNPYYIEELIKMLLDEGVILRGSEADDHWKVQLSRLGAVKVPPTLTGVLQARLDSLPPVEKEILQRASVVGRLFWDTAVQYLIGVPYEEHSKTTEISHVTDILASLQRRELIFKRERSTFENTSEFMIKHSLLRDVVYESVLLRLRPHYHARTAEWLIQASGARVDEYADLIAGHWFLAENPTYEAEWQARAGKHAAARYAHTEAIRYLSRALELTPESAVITRFDLLLAREQVYALQGARTLQANDLNSLEILAANQTDPLLQASVALRRSGYYEAIGDYPVALEAAQQAWGYAAAADDLSGKASAYLSWGKVLWRMADYPASQAQLQKALEIVQETKARHQETSILLILGNVVWSQGESHLAQKYYTQAFSIAREIGDRHGEGRALGNLGTNSWSQGDYSGARSFYEKSLHLLREVGNRWPEGTVLNNLGDVAQSQGDYSSAQGYYEQALDIAREIGDRLGEGHALSNIGNVIANQKDVTSARTYFEQALFIARELQDRRSEAFALTRLGHSLINEGLLDEAEAVFQRAFDLRRALREPHLAAESQAGLVKVFLAKKNFTAALKHAETILEYIKTEGLEGIEEPFRVFLICFQILQSVDDSRAYSFLDQSYLKLVHKAEKMDNTTRQMYLENIPFHREILTLWQGLHENVSNYSIQYNV